MISLRDWLGDHVAAPMIGVLARSRRPRAAGRLMARLISGRSQPAPARLLTLPKPGFTQDAQAAFGGDDRLAILGFSRALVKAPYPSFLPPEMDDNNYRSAAPEFDAAKAGLREFWAQAWPHIQSRARADAVLTGNFGYFAEQELAAVVEAQGTPFIAMHKESLKTPGRQVFFERLYRQRRQPFPGRRILVYNTIERDVQVAAGIAPAANITVCGMPRLDDLHVWRAQGAHDSDPRARPMVLMFSFHPKTGLPFIPRKPGGPMGRMENLAPDEQDLAWTKLHLEFHKAAARLAREHPGLDVVVKGKADLPKWLKETTGGSLHLDGIGNLRVVVGGDPHALIKAASVVTGFGTTALLETLAAGKQLVLPHFGEAAAGDTLPFVLDLGDAARCADSPEEFVELLRDGADGDPTPVRTMDSETAQALDKWAGNSDGAAGRRVAEAVLGEIGPA